MIGFRLVWLARKACGLGLALTGALSMLGVPGDIQLWYRCLREQQCPSPSLPPLDERALWSSAFLLLGIALLIPDRWWRRRHPRPLEIVFDPVANTRADHSGKIIACTVALHNAGRRRLSGVSLLLTAWFTGGPPNESDQVILSSLRRRHLVPLQSESTQAEYALKRDQELEFQVAAFQNDDKARYVLTFGDAIGLPETGEKARPVASIVAVPAGQYRVLIRAQAHGTLPADRYFTLTLQDGAVAMVTADETR